VKSQGDADPEVDMPLAEGAGEMSLHQRILGDIEERILSGEWPPGFRIPFEVDLAEQYRCSRMTVNKALTQLAKTGLIERRRKSGSYVTQPLAQSAVLEIRDIKLEVQSLGLPYDYKLSAKARRRSNAEDRSRLGLDAAAPILDVTCTHFAGHRPFCVEQRLINLAAVPDAAAETFEEMAPGPWLLNRVPYGRAAHLEQWFLYHPRAPDLSRRAACAGCQFHAVAAEIASNKLLAYFFGLAPESLGTSLVVVALKGVAAFATTLSFFGFLVSLLLFTCPLAMAGFLLRK
jgi:GntR family histidine utilization transcriptional repressor